MDAKEKVLLETLGYFESDSGEDDDSLDSQSDCESNQLNTASSSESNEGTSDHKEGHLGVILEAGQLKSGAIDMGKTQLERNHPSESNQGTSDGKKSHVGVVLKASRLTGVIDMCKTQLGRSNAGEGGSLMGRDPDITHKNVAMTFTPSHEHLLLVLRENKLNWFSFALEMEMTFTHCTEVLDQMLLDFSHYLYESDLSPEEEHLVEQS